MTENCCLNADYIYQLIENRRYSIERKAKNIIDDIQKKFHIKTMDDGKKLAIQIFEYLTSFIIFLMFVQIYQYIYAMVNLIF